MKLLLINLTNSFFIVLFFSSEICAKKIEANYLIELAKINIGSVHWTIDKNNEKYKTLISLKDRGILSSIFKFSGKYSSEGVMREGKFISLKYNQSWKTKKKKREVEILFKNEMVYKLVQLPIEHENPRTNYLNIKKLTDPLSAFLNILTNSNSDLKTIDGRRLYKMVVDNNKLIGSRIIKKIVIIEYLNIWADHNKKDLNSLEIEQTLPYKNTIFPDIIKIKHKGLVFSLTKI